MKSTQRHTAFAAGFLALSLIGTPALAQYGVPHADDQAGVQRGGPANADTPHLLVGTFDGSDHKTALDVTSEIRQRLIDQHSQKELYIVTEKNIKATLAASGYTADSALSPSDLVELGRQLQAQYVLDGRVDKVGDRLKASPRIVLRTTLTSTPQTTFQPLGVIDGKDAGDVAKSIDKSVGEFLKSLPSFTKCSGDLRAQRFDAAAADAREGIKAYGNSTLNRLCLLYSQASAKAVPDSIISASLGLLAYDSASTAALSFLADAYQAKGDTNKFIETSLKVYHADPSNTVIAQGIVNQLASSGAPDRALPIVEELLRDNPADPNFLHTKWLLQLRSSQWKAAIATGEQLAKLDTAAVTVDFYQRQIGAAQNDSNKTKVDEYVSKAAQKFPKDFQLYAAQLAYKNNQFDQAYHAALQAAAANPKSTAAWQLAMLSANALKMPDSLTAIGRRAIAAGASKDTIGTIMLQPAVTAINVAQASSQRADWENAFKAASGVDSIARSQQTQYLVGVSSFQIAYAMYPEVQKLYQSTKKADRDQACAEAKQMEDYLATTQMSMMAGGGFDQKTAAQVLQAATQIGDFVSGVKKGTCPK